MDQQTVRGNVCPTSAIQFCLMAKVLFGLPLRQTTGMLSSILKMPGLDWAVPDVSTLSRRQGETGPWLSRRRESPMNEWLARKHGTHRRQQRKVHLAMDTATGDIRAVEVASCRNGHNPLLPEFSGQIPEDEEIGTATGELPADAPSPIGRGPLATPSAQCGAMRRSWRTEARGLGHSFGPVAVMCPPIRKTGRLWKEDCPAALARNDILRATRRLGRTIWKRWSGYHVHSRIEASMRNLKSFGERIASRDPNRRTAEIHIRVICGYARTDGACRSFMNRFNAPGTAEIERVA